MLEDRAYFIATLYTRFDAEKTTEQLAKRQIMMIKNNIVVRQKPQDKRKKIIQVIVHYVDLNKAYSQGFSFQWAPQIGDQTSVSTIGGGPAGFKVVPAITATINNFFPKLNWLKSFNFARVLHNANLTLQDGEEGVISVNKSVPYTSRGSDGQISVQQAQTEISTVITPKIVGPTQDTVQMKVTVKVGSIGVTTSAGPSIDSRMIQTNIHVRDRLSAVLGGLITSDVAKGYNRLPPNSSQTPIVNLFSAKDYSTSKSQFVVFITPIIKASASAGVSRIKDKFKVDGD